VKFQEPPKRKQPSQFWVDIVKKLRENPKRPALIGDYSAAVGSHIRNGFYPAFIPSNTDDAKTFMKRNFEVQTVKRPDKRYDLYITYIGAE